MCTTNDTEDLAHDVASAQILRHENGEKHTNEHGRDRRRNYILVLVVHRARGGRVFSWQSRRVEVMRMGEVDSERDRRGQPAIVVVLERVRVFDNARAVEVRADGR